MLKRNTDRTQSPKPAISQVDQNFSGLPPQATKSLLFGGSVSKVKTPLLAPGRVATRQQTFHNSRSKAHSLSYDLGIVSRNNNADIQEARNVSECYRQLWVKEQHVKQSLSRTASSKERGSNQYLFTHRIVKSDPRTATEVIPSKPADTPKKDKAAVLDVPIEQNKGGTATSATTIVNSKDEHIYKPDWSKFEDAYAENLSVTEEGVAKSLTFLSEMVDLLLDYVHKVGDRNSKVLDFHHPHQLKEALGHCLDLPKDPRDLEQILSDCKETLKYGVKTGHPRFFNQISTGLDVMALAGEWLTAVANTNMFTYEIAPVFTLMEEVTLQRMRAFIGWTDGDGIFAPGGAIANLYGILCARHVAFPQVKHEGMSGLGEMVIFTSSQSHFSVKRGAIITGLGTKHVVEIPCNERGQMRVTELEAAILEAQKKHQKPIMVSCTGGTTVLGAFDPVDEIADVCERFNLWLHVDCAWGGGALLSSTHRHLLKGIHRANSVTWNPHKAMGITLQCSAILLREKMILSSCNSMHADYLFQQDKQYDTSYDTGDKAIQCGRHNDIFKLWLVWRSKGDEGFENQINRLFNLAKQLLNMLKEREGFELVLDNPEYLNISFWYVPRQMRGMPKGKERDEALNQVAPKIKAKMMEAGTTMVGYQPLGKLPNFFRVIISNQAIEVGDLKFLLDEIEKLGEEE